MSAELINQSAIALFKYIEKLCAIRRATVKDIQKEPVSIICENWVTDEANIQLVPRTGEEDEDPVLLRIRKPDFHFCPEPGEILMPWLEDGWDDYRKPAVVRKKIVHQVDVQPLAEEGPQAEEELLDTEIEAEDSDMQPGMDEEENLEQNEDVQERIEALQQKNVVELFGDSSERVAALQAWSQKRADWVEEQKRIEEVRKLFSRFYEVRNILTKEPESYEFMIGNGMLKDLRNPSYCHPILLKRVTISLVANGNTLVISDSDSDSQLYTMMLSEMEGLNTNVLSAEEQKVSENAVHPFNRKEAGQFLRSFIHLLSAQSCYIDSPNTNPGREDRFIMRWCPVFFLRKKIDGSVATVKKIIGTLEEGAEVPGSLIGILGGNADCEESGWNQKELGTSGAAPIKETEILLPKESNREQLDIALEIEKHPAVLVQGPPGTGKTHTIANLLGHFLAQGKRVLVTSQTNKALRVLKEKIPKDIQPLCITVFDDSKEDMERSVEGIIEYMGTHTPEQVQDAAEKKREERTSILAQLQRAQDLVYMIRNKEFSPIVYMGESFSPMGAAQYVSEHADILETVPGSIEEGAAFPLTQEELNALYQTNETLSQYEEEELQTGLPAVDELIPPEKLREYIELEKNAETILTEIGRQIGVMLAWNHNLKSICHAVSGETFAACADRQCVANALEAMERYPDRLIQLGWIPKVIAEGSHQDSHRENWKRLSEAIRETYAYAESIFDETFGKQIEIQSTASENELIAVYQELYQTAQKKGNIGKLGIFTPKNKKLAVEQIRINGENPYTLEQVKLVLDDLELVKKRKNLASLWNALMIPCGEKRFEQMGEEPERQCMTALESIDRFLDWYHKERPVLVECLEKAGLQHEFLKTLAVADASGVDERTAKEMLTFIMEKVQPAVKTTSLLQRMCGYEGMRSQSLDRLKQDSQSTVCQNLLHALSEMDAQNYEAYWKAFVQLPEKKAIADVRESLLKKVWEAAPDWAQAIAHREDIHAESKPPEALWESWKCKQLDLILQRIAGQSLSDAEKAVYTLNGKLKKVTANLSANLAWYHMLERIFGNIGFRQALNGWKQTIKKIGKGTGKKAPMLRKEAQRLMTTCQKAVPAWIMSVSKVMDTVNPAETKFDVVIIDEASQCDVTAMALLYMGKKVIVVGDDEQVSPMAVGADEGKIQALADSYIKNKIPNWHLFSLKDSLYDIVARCYKPLMLREHFRCVPDIIGYSNMLSYDYHIKPLREAGSTLVQPGVVPYRVKGKRDGKNKINEVEAHTIVALMMACMEQPEYKDETFGVISLLGSDQVKLIDRILYERMDLVTRENRRILCGDASSFQGDERDVIFLSMVDSNESNGPLRIQAEGVGGATKQRYNVAVSRARDQLWVVNSLDYTRDLKEGDIRRGLLEYAENPQANAMRVRQIEDESESPFEEEVAKYLLARGYHIKQQWPVGGYRIDMVAMCGRKKIAIECDGEQFHSSEEQIRGDIERQNVLERLGWRFIRIRGSEYYRDREKAMQRVLSELQSYEIVPEKQTEQRAEGLAENDLLKRVKIRADQILESWCKDGLKIEYEADPAAEFEQETAVGLSEPVEKPKLPVQDLKKKEERRTVPDSVAVVNRTRAEQIQMLIESPKQADYEQIAMEGVVHTVEDYISELEKSGLTCMDNRASSGIIWVLYAGELREAFQTISAQYGMTYKIERRGSLATGGKPAWRVMCK